MLDDDRDVLHTARLILKPHFAHVQTESDPGRIPDLLREAHYDVVLLDMNFTPGATDGKEGLYWLRKLRELAPETQVVMNTAYGDIAIAVEAMKEGAIDFLVKPWEKEKLLTTVRNVYELSRARREVAQLKSREQMWQQDLDRPFAEIISQSPAMELVFEAIRKVADTNANVLILGENGTGKELVARAIHRQSGRAAAPFIKVDLGAISETLFESELFGHRKGAFTDAKEDRPGRFELAHGGTLFLDEIGNVSLPLQAKLLTALQSRQVTRVGANHPTSVDIRLICATNQPLYERVEEGAFRQDLLYRINTVELSLPPLRERPEDVPLLVAHYLDLYRRKYQKAEVQLDAAAHEKLLHYAWPGNIRELQHAVERAVIMSEQRLLHPADFLLTGTAAGSATRRARRPEPPPSYHLETLEREAIQKAIEKHRGNLSQAAAELGLGRTTLYRKMEKYGL
ncbi:DNA-binding transcriptional response regulator, NtrC family, contains REC, AAA-type ATPase, and a Fis-type DNA-binding domains [Catalinimonas alkaloidigena]|uniref:DNA-binding transcriptional response regulator, NtrC family, contains REC, AAA-type ATPase, and a Fis-type DNA-binding domains n=1 Tax=Catalinimonas alkaloidigena TaxID=1075417 RepID=A0A1G9FCN5_9BACT|nr:DNA-binding transcriptional response regulator, NtrC family, contains REC, AAA-type ATPase, and a Fis-type DNA-binding domains [Catalinimonas alkaloidigena]